MNINELLNPALAAETPSTPIMKLAATEAIRPAHESLDIGSVHKEAVHEFAHGIAPVEAGADDTELGGIEQTGIYKRLLHYAHRHAAHIIERIAEGDSQKGLETLTLPDFVSIFRRNFDC